MIKQNPSLSKAGANTEEAKNRLHRKMISELGIIHAHLQDPNVIEVMVNPDGNIWIERFGEMPEIVGEMSESQRSCLIATIATSLNTIATKDQPIVEGELAIDKSRFEGLISPIVESPAFTIRKRASKVFTLQDYLDAERINRAQMRVIENAVKTRKNILCVGGTGSGKTTFCNAVIHQIEIDWPEHRIVIIEDTREIQCSSKNVVQLRTSDNIGMLELLKATMRLRPDRILVGEVRGGEALSLLKSWNTGHDGGLSTVHANSARAGLIRLEQLINEGVSNTDARPDCRSD